MLWIVDLDYTEDASHVGVVEVNSATDPAPIKTHRIVVAGQPAPYEPGEFWKRELPPLLAAFAAIRPETPPDVIMIDGYATLGGGRPGLGARLREHWKSSPIPVVVGVAKNYFAGSDAIPVLRGASKSPLYVSALGASPEAWAEAVKIMHGPHRLPTLIKLADSLARGR